MLLCPPKCLFLKCLLCQNVYSHDVYYGNLQDRADVNARFTNLRSPVCIVLTFLPARDNLKTVWIWIRTVKTVGLIRIQTVCHSDGIPENSLEKIMTMVIMLTLYLLVTVCKLVVTRSGTSNDFAGSDLDPKWFDSLVFLKNSLELLQSRIMIEALSFNLDTLILALVLVQSR